MWPNVRIISDGLLWAPFTSPAFLEFFVLGTIYCWFVSRSSYHVSPAQRWNGQSCSVYESVISFLPSYSVQKHLQMCQHCFHISCPLQNMLTMQMSLVFSCSVIGYRSQCRFVWRWNSRAEFRSLVPYLQNKSHNRGWDCFIFTHWDGYKSYFLDFLLQGCNQQP